MAQRTVAEAERAFLGQLEILRQRRLTEIEHDVAELRAQKK